MRATPFPFSLIFSGANQRSTLPQSCFALRSTDSTRNDCVPPPGICKLVATELCHQRVRSEDLFMISSGSVRAMARLSLIGVLSVWGFPLSAANITIGSVTATVKAGMAGYDQNYTSISTGGTSAFSLSTSDAPNGDATSSVSVSVSSSRFSYTFTQSFTDPDYTYGSASGMFMATSAVLYSISDTAPTVIAQGDDTLYYDTSLQDQTTHTTLYDTLNGGSLTGTLTIGDNYSFSSMVYLQTPSDPTLSYNPSITFSNVQAAPENPAPLIPVVLTAISLLRRRLAAPK